MFRRRIVARTSCTEDNTVNVCIFLCGLYIRALIYIRIQTEYIFDIGAHGTTLALLLYLIARHGGRMAPHDRIKLFLKRHYWYSLHRLPVSLVWAAPYMQTQKGCFFRYEVLKTQKYVTHHDLLQFLKLKKFIQLF